MNFKDNLKKIRKDNNLSQEELAEKLNVTRQSVSKWESGIAYPEMDKVIQICKMFNLNIDDLLNKDITEVNEAKESKNTINKYIDDFLNYITKACKVISSMSLFQIIKCLLEQCLIILLLFIAAHIIGAIGSTILHAVFNLLPNNAYNVIYSIFESIYLIFALVVSITIIIHIFKIRYLDYYEIVDEDVSKEVKTSKEEETLTSVKEDKKDKTKIIIRDAKHSGYGFISFLAKAIIFLLKFFAACILLGVICALIGIVITLVLSFMFVKTGLLFLGALIGLLSSILITIVIIYVLFNFIINKKSKIGFIFISLIISIIGIGMGIGMFVSGIKDYHLVDESDPRYIREVVKYDMVDELFIDRGYYFINFKVDNRPDVKIEMIHTDFNNVKVDKNGNTINFIIDDRIDVFEALRKSIDDINNKEVIDYGKLEINVYASSENIDKLTKNYHKNYER